ncbi:MAG: A/G-specific adenine glycosylase [Bacteroidota bacterium]
MTLLAPLIKWYHASKRDLPWRETTDPYRIWLSEVIMQQTRVEQGLPYYNKFVDKYPTLHALANANDDDVMKLWQGLGYYSRASNMLKTARIIEAEHEGVFPDTYNRLLELKGIGPYTAAAISSFAFNEAQAVVDGNVYRVLSRLFAIDEPINSSKGKKLFAEVAREVLNEKVPATHNQAIMELGATVCKPKQALCNVCVLRLQCEAYKQNRVYDFPVKDKKRKPVDRFLNYIFIKDARNNTYIRQRVDEGIWNMLYEFPVIETQAATDENELLEHAHLKERFSHQPQQLRLLFASKHQLTHQTIYAVFWLAEGQNIVPLKPEGFIKINLNLIHNYAVPRLLERFINHILPQQ